MNGGQGSLPPPVCQNCSTSTTPLWRRDESGAVLCNACGLFLKLHGSPRPISLKTDVIKSRNRVKTAGQQGAKRKSLFGESLPASQTPAPQSTHQTQQAPQPQTNNDAERLESPLSRTDTPSHPSNIAPQHMFDGVTLSDHHFDTLTIPHLPPRNPSPGSTSSNNDRHLEPPQTYEDLVRENRALKTRVSELEVINGCYEDHFRRGQHPAPQAEMISQDLATAPIRQDLDTSEQREASMRRQIEDLEHELSGARGEQPAAKRARRSSQSEYPEPPTSLTTNGISS